MEGFLESGRDGAGSSSVAAGLGVRTLGLNREDPKGRDYVILVTLCPELLDQSLVHSRHSVNFCKTRVPAMPHKHQTVSHHGGFAPSEALPPLHGSSAYPPQSTQPAAQTHSLNFPLSHHPYHTEFLVLVYFLSPHWKVSPPPHHRGPGRLSHSALSPDPGMANPYLLMAYFE